MDWEDTLVVADRGNRRLREVNARTGATSTLAGDGQTPLSEFAQKVAVAIDANDPSMAVFEDPSSVAWSPDGSAVVGACRDGLLMVNYTTGEKTVLVAGKRLAGTSAAALTYRTLDGRGEVGFDGEWERLFEGCLNTAWFITHVSFSAWNPATGTLKTCQELCDADPWLNNPVRNRPCKAVVFWESPVGNFNCVGFAGENGGVPILPSRSNNCPGEAIYARKQRAILAHVFDVSWSPDGRTIAFSDLRSRRIRLLDLRTNYVSTLAGNGLSTVGFAVEGNQFHHILGRNGWEVQPDCNDRAGAGGRACSRDSSSSPPPDGSRPGVGPLTTINTASGGSHAELGYVKGLAYSPDGATIAFVEDTGGVRLVDVALRGLAKG
jgi:WD40 repeat protein